ncbi:hypothetical protein THMIRHAS_23190 [Thiosulfatimonas sediminis]|uniref:DUF2914 domain-containing protein n=1 Tax=Thiosulfatimonas sediminis TaxID=2675054 RepID=A0A6F8PXW8_9GAMM|nr:DUF2914 domain-containing protein [Thiosulfatimonas sediminis]BBP46946.1 hypothetical protein THMIRHAS_23190 [Thiosulfatimonas sediminis]
MPIADSENPAHQRAFKTGYRYGLAGKSLSHMPHDIRQDACLRDYFAQGWEVSQEDINSQRLLLAKPNWRYRIAWFTVMVLGGLATSGVMLKQINEQNQQANVHQLQNSISPNTTATGLMSDAQRADMQFRAEQFAQIAENKTPLSPIIPDSNVQIVQAQIRAQGQNFPLSLSQRFEKSPIILPKYLRTLEFNAQLSLNKPQTIYLHWRYDGLIIQKGKFSLEAGLQSLSATELMTSARQGRWYIELLDSKQQVFKRMAFNYGNLDENH